MALEYIKIKDADNVDRLVLVDVIAGEGSGHAQVAKVAFGADGNLTLVDGATGLPVAVLGTVAVTGELEVKNDAGNPIPIAAAALPLPAGAATEATQNAVGAAVVALNADLGDAADSAADSDAGTFSLIALFKRLLGKAGSLLTTVPPNDVAAPPVRAVGQDVWNVSFADVGASVLAPELKPAGYPITGTGITYSQANGNLAIVAGTTANAEFLTRSVQSWQGALRFKFSIVASQRIAQNNLAVMLADLVGEGLTYNIVSATVVDVIKNGHNYTAQNVGQFMMLGGITGAAGVPGRYAIASIPDANTIRFTVAGWPGSGSGTLTLFGHSYVRNLFTGTTATQASFDCQRRGWADAAVTATINTTASPGTVIANECTGRELFLADQLRASTTTPTVAARASRLENLPDDNLPLYVFVWNYNGTSNPATSTTWTISFMAVEKFANTPVYLQGARANGAINPIPVAFPSAQAVSGTVTANIGTGSIAAGTAAIGDVGQQYRANATGAATRAHIVSAATTNPTVIKASAGRLVGGRLSNTTASWRYIKLHNQATSPTAGTGVIGTIGLPPNSTITPELEGGEAFTTGIAMTTVTGSADADATAVAAGDIVGDLFFA